MRFGAQPRDHSKPAPALEHYLTDVRAFGADPLPLSPSIVDRVSRVKTIPMYKNDAVGDCTVAAMLHMFETWAVYSGKAMDGGLFADAEAIKIYSAVSGYDPATGANDNGAQLADVCRYMVKTGAVDKAGKVHKLAAWAEIGDYSNLRLLKRTLNAFGANYLAIQVPSSAMQQFNAGQPWRYVGDQNIEGGHAIPQVYSAVNTGAWDDEQVETWGARQKVNESFAHAYLCEAIACVSADQVNAAGLNPAGLRLDALVHDCQTQYMV